MPGHQAARASSELHLVGERAPATELRGLSKRFGRLAVLRGVDCSLAAGRVTALVGPNAAGKTTLIKVILGLIKADAGTVTVAGEAIGSDPEYRSRIGYMPQAARFPENLSGREVMELLISIRRSGAVTDDGLIRTFGLEAELDKPVKTLSGGTRQKLNAVCAFLFKPQLLILDEPTAGLDPVASGVLKQKIMDAREAGVSVLLTSHVMSELEQLADDVVFMLEGKVRFEGTLAGLRRKTGRSALEHAIASMMRGEEVLG